MTVRDPAEENRQNETSFQTRLVASLRDRSVYDHPTRTIRVVETHISYVILTGVYAYKIKKSLRLGFLDFSTLEKRHYYCQQELRLNQRLAPDLYLSVVAITGSARCPSLNGSGSVVEYAVKMVQFDSAQELIGLIGSASIGFDKLADLAATVAGFHDGVAKAAADSEYGSADRIRQRMKDNVDDILPCLDGAGSAALGQLDTWIDRTNTVVAEQLSARKENGFVRECHGDMHLGNMVLIEARIRLFDCLEFSEQFRWVDVMSEIAFLFMDLEYRGRPDFAYEFLNKYLQACGDYTGLRVFWMYCVYRAMVRAKVACIRHRQPAHSEADMLAVTGHLELAHRYTQRMEGQMIITHGYSGSGKSWVAERVARMLPAIHLRSDVERNRMERSGDPGIQNRKYSARSIESVYMRLLELAGEILDSGFSVLVDATFTTAANRLQFFRLANDRGVPFTVLDVQCPESILRSRVRARLLEAKDASEATINVLDQQIRNADPLQEVELESQVIRVNNDGSVIDFHDLVQTLLEIRCQGDKK